MQDKLQIWRIPFAHDNGLILPVFGRIRKIQLDHVPTIPANAISSISMRARPVLNDSGMFDSPQ